MTTNALPLLIGPHIDGVLRAAVGGCGATLDDIRLADLRIHPTGSVRARYLADMRLSGGARGSQALVAATGEHIPPGATIVTGEYRDEPVDVGVWHWALDPALPALRTAAHPTLLAEFLAAQGVPIDGTLNITLRAYRPTQRAVLEVRDAASRWFVKVVRPEAVAELLVRHALLSTRLPVPPVVAHSCDGLIVLPEAHGTLLAEGLRSDCAPLVDPAQLEAVHDALPGDLMSLRGPRSILQRVHDSKQVLRTCVTSDPNVPTSVAAELESEASRLADGILSAGAHAAEPLVPVHGDFYYGQLLTEGSRITGLLDVDTAGPGERVDEWATMIGYLSVLGLSQPRARTYCDAIHTYARRRVDPRDLRRRTAAVVLGLASAPFRARLADWPERTADRLELARTWLFEH